MDDEIEELDATDEWGRWECPKCGTEWEDPDSIWYTCCGQCEQVVELTYTDEYGQRSAKAVNLGIK